MRLKGRKALVTGAGSDGIGAATALALAREGASVAVHHLNQDDHAATLCADIAAMGGTAMSVKADLAVAANARRMVREASEGLGGLDSLVACAATLRRVPFLELSDEEWDRVQAVNLRGTFAVAQEAARLMVAAGKGGRIALVSSVNQDHPTKNLAHYVASKGGVKMLGRAMAMELAEVGITVNLIAPGTVETDINRAALADPAFRAEKEALIPLKAIAKPSDVAGAAVYLLSDEAAYMTGATLTVDGGLTL